MRRLLVLCALATVPLLAAPQARALPATPELAPRVIVLPEPEARKLIEGFQASVALGVYPPSRDPAAFLRAIGTVPGGDENRRLGDLLGTARIAATRSAAAPIVGALLEAFGPTAERVSIDVIFEPDADADPSVLVASNADDARLLLRGRAWNLIVLGVGDRTPVLAGFGRYGTGAPRWLAEAETRRPGLVTPTDVARYILGSAGRGVGVERPAFVLRPDPDPLARLDALRARLERDVGLDEPITKVTVSLGIAGLFFGAIALRAGRARLGGAFFRAAAMMPVGYVGALFIQDGRWMVRATALAAAFVFGLTFWVPHDRRFCGWVFLLSGLGIAALTIAAAANPTGEPALTLWGNPLTSYRFFGLRNHMAAFLSGGLIAGGALLAVPWWFHLGITGGAAALLGSATLGANFLGVLTLVFGGVLAASVLLARRARWWHVPIAALAALGATVAALAADTVAASHGGRAFGTIRDDGIDRALDLLRARGRLNLDLITDIGAAAWVGLVGMVLVLAALFVWTWRGGSASYAVRAAVAGCSAAALAALVMEDSGFYVAGILGVYPAAAWGAWRADLNAATRAAPPPPAASEPATA